MKETWSLRSKYPSRRDEVNLVTGDSDPRTRTSSFGYKLIKPKIKRFTKTKTDKMEVKNSKTNGQKYEILTSVNDSIMSVVTNESFFRV